MKIANDDEVEEVIVFIFLSCMGLFTLLRCFLLPLNVCNYIAMGLLVLPNLLVFPRGNSRKVQIGVIIF
jgi:hypothetical protein